MAVKTWEAMKVRFCERANCEVALEGEFVYPSDVLPDQPPRVISHRCSHGLECIRQSQSACAWSGGNPNYDPFTE